MLNASVGLGAMIMNVFCLSIGMGLNNALDTLVSQAFGNGQFELCGLYLNRARIVNLFVIVPIIVVLVFTEELLVAFG